MSSYVLRRQSGPRTLRASDDAVSAVISTILMVAVTVVLAAAAFLLVADVGGRGTAPAPAVGFRADDATHRVQVTSADSHANWKRIRISLASDTGSGTIYVGRDAAGGYMNEPAANTGASLAGAVQVSTASANLIGGDFVEFCRSSGGATGSITLNIEDIDSNALIGTYTITNLPASC